MNGLSKSQLQFLNEQGIEIQKTFDAKGLNQSQYRARMKPYGKIIAFNVSPCQKEGHTLRTRSGHCAQCNTAHIGFQKRTEEEGIIYIAGTKQGRLIKVGFTKGVEVRSESLNRTKYGGFSDWVILYAVKSSKAGEIEIKVKSKLSASSCSRDYIHDGKIQKTDELYQCSYLYAKQGLESLIKNGKFNATTILDNMGKNYQFSEFKLKSEQYR